MLCSFFILVKNFFFNFLEFIQFIWNQEQNKLNNKFLEKNRRALDLVINYFVVFRVAKIVFQFWLELKLMFTFCVFKVYDFNGYDSKKQDNAEHEFYI